MYQYYLVSSDNLEFIAVFDIDHKEDEFTLYLGNPLIHQEACVIINSKNNSMTIQDLKYKNTCTLDKNMEKGEAGTVKMLKIAIELYRQICPNKLTKIDLDDESGYYIFKTNRGRRLVPLSMQSYFMYGKTWYQRFLPELNFQAKNKELIEKYDNVFNNFDKYREIVKDTESRNWTEFYRKIRITTENIYVDIMDPLNEKVFKLVSLQGRLWIGKLPKKSLINIEYRKIEKPNNLEVFIGGGKNMPRRNR